MSARIIPFPTRESPDQEIIRLLHELRAECEQCRRGNFLRLRNDESKGTGRSSVSASDRFGRTLGWLSLALGCAELLAPRRITQALGMAGTEPLV